MSGARDRAELVGLVLELVRAPVARRQPLSESVARLGRLPASRVIALLEEHGLAQLALDAVERAGLRGELAGELSRWLVQTRRAAVGLLLAQERAIANATQALAAARVPYLVFKGQQLGRALYADPALRPAADVDLLVGDDRRDAALAALARAGFAGTAHRENATHEVSLLALGACVDLHWHLVRPGRARLSLGSWLLARRVQANGLWAPDDAGMLVIMLVHNALTDHVTQRLIRAVDLDRWARRPMGAWGDAVEVIGRAGLRGAAWATLEWARTALATPVPPEVLRELAPSRARQLYLRAWLARDPARVYRRHPSLVRAAFSLSLHDSVRDVVRAVSSLARAARESERQCAEINHVLREP